MSEFQKVAVLGDDGIAAFLRSAGVDVVAAGADLVIAAGPERPGEKRAELAAAAAASPEAVLVTTSSVLSVTELAAALPAPERFAGLVFHVPLETTLTVEVVPGLRTDEAVVERLAAFADGLPGKQALVVRDRPGALLNALLLPYLNDVLGAYDEELASAEDLDVALQLGLGYRTGPMELLDRIGLEKHLDATTAAYEATGDARYAPPPLLRRLVAAEKGLRK